MIGTITTRPWYTSPVFLRTNYMRIENKNISFLIRLEIWRLKYILDTSIHWCLIKTLKYKSFRQCLSLHHWHAASHNQTFSVHSASYNFIIIGSCIFPNMALLFIIWLSSSSVVPISIPDNVLGKAHTQLCLTHRTLLVYPSQCSREGEVVEGKDESQGNAEKSREMVEIKSTTFQLFKYP